MKTALIIALISAWTSGWISHPDAESPVLRKDINVENRISNATLKVCGLGFYEFFIDSEKVGDAVLAPNETAYSRRGAKINTGAIPMDDSRFRGCHVCYNTFDVTKALSRKGAHRLEAILGNGFYNTDANRFVSSYGKPCFSCSLEITYKDGKKETIVSDTSWKARRSPIVQNDLFLGETFDARIAKADEPWVDAVFVKGPEGEMVPQIGPADRVVKTFKPTSITKLSDGKWEVKFPEYFSGWIRLNDFTLSLGKEIVIEFPVETAGNGEMRYIGDGSFCKTYAPRFSWYMIDKAIVSGWEGELTAANITGEMVHTDVASALEFKCSDQLINDIQQMWRRTEMCNMHLSVATDCPHREKGPYTGDGQVSCVTVMHNFATKDFYRQWMMNLRDCQDVKTGYVPNGAPWHPGCGGGAAWGAAMNIFPWEHYVHFGDKQTLAENFEAMKMQVDFMTSWKRPDGTILIQMPSADAPNYWMNLGEWCPPYGLVGERLVHTWYSWRCADYTAKAALALGRTDDAARYGKIRDEIASAFNESFWDESKQTYCCEGGTTASDNYGTGDGGGYGDGANIYALALGVPADRLEKVRATVRKELELNNGHFNTGIYGSSLFFEVLCDNGMADEAYIAFTKTDYPSFGKMLVEGPGTMWEQWNGKDSRCHPMYGGSLVWLYRKLAGVEALEPGYSKVLVRPHPVKGVDWVDFSMDIPAGKITVNWKKRPDGTLDLKVKAPKGVEVVTEQ